MASHHDCAICGKHDYVAPLHGDKGGPLCCLICAGKWQAEHGRRRRLGRIVIRAMAYQESGGKWTDIDLLKLSALRIRPRRQAPLVTAKVRPGRYTFYP